QPCPYPQFPCLVHWGHFIMLVSGCILSPFSFYYLRFASNTSPGSWSIKKDFFCDYLIKTCVLYQSIASS
ncbi:TPA: hypothetical protein ACWC78_003006, partial [Legionella pneumophila]